MALLRSAGAAPRRFRHPGRAQPHPCARDPAAAGLIFDRNGVLLADNRPGFILSIVIERAGNLDLLLAELQRLIALGDAELERFRQLAARRRPYESVPLRYNLTEEEQSILAVNEYRFEGLEISAQLVRHYPQGAMLAHVLGYMGRIDETELKAIDADAYRGVYSIGKAGLERFYEAELLGKPGYEYAETNARGRVMRVIERIEPTAGQNLRLHLDLRLQQEAYAALAGERGAVVAIDVRDGGVLALASAPGFDPNPFVTGISSAAYRELTQSPDRPYSTGRRAGSILRAPPSNPCSPWPRSTAAWSLRRPGSMTRAFSTGKQLPSLSRLEAWRPWLGDDAGCRGAVVRRFFYTVGTRLGIDRLYQTGTQFGLGVKTGIDLPNEAAGVMPSRDWKRAARSASWYQEIPSMPASGRVS